MRSHDRKRVAPLTQELQDAKSVTVKQVGPAPGKPRTIVAFEAAVIDWLPSARIPSWPGVLGDSSKRPEIRLQSAPFHRTCYADCRSEGRKRLARRTTTDHLTEESRYPLFDGVLGATS